MAIEGIRGIVEAAIQRASQATGVDFSFLMKTAGRESGMNPAAKAGGSSAAGLFQFVEQTWLSTLKQHGAKHGYARYAELISKGPDGHYHVAGSGAPPAGRAATVGEVYANLTKTAGSALPIEAAPAAPTEDGGFIQYASARRADHQRQQEALISLILRGAQPSDQMGVGSRLTSSMFTSE